VGSELLFQNTGTLKARNSCAIPTNPDYLSCAYRSAKFFNFFPRLLFYFRSEKFRTSVNGKINKRAKNFSFTVGNKVRTLLKTTTDRLYNMMPSNTAKVHTLENKITLLMELHALDCWYYKIFR